VNQLTLSVKEKIDFTTNAFAKIKLSLFEGEDEVKINSLAIFFSHITKNTIINDSQLIDECYKFMKRKFIQSNRKADHPNKKEVGKKCTKKILRRKKKLISSKKWC
jgi:hypothetical protein